MGIAHSPFNLVGRKPREYPESMVLQGITLERLQDRNALRRSFDRFRREADVARRMEGIDTYTDQALGILTDSKLGDALDLSKEDPRIVARYGKSDERFQRDGAPRMIENFCIARRLVEAGARYVALNYSRWDWHGGDGMNYPDVPRGVPAARQRAVGTGHRPARAGPGQGRLGRRVGRVRPHAEDQQQEQPRPLAAGQRGDPGRRRHADRAGHRREQPQRRRCRMMRPVKFQEIFATLYHNLGLDAHRDRVFDGSGTPRYPVDPDIEPLHELI